MGPPVPPPAGTPAAEVHVSTGLVQDLLAAQHPDLATLPLRHAASGWDNETFRLGERLAVRLPRRAAAAGLVANEQRWLPEIAPAVPLPVPEPVRVGAPGCGYPWSWSVVPWLPGAAADLVPPTPAAAVDLARFLAALHRPAPAAAPHNPFRGVDLAERTAAVQERLRRLAPVAGAEVAVAAAAWADGLAAPPARERRLLHGDLHPRNVLVRDGRISAVIDWGDVAGGDAATDLAAVWLLFDTAAHGAFWRAYGDADAALRTRARAWAASFAVVLLETGLGGDPPFVEVARRTLARLAG